LIGTLLSMRAGVLTKQGHFTRSLTPP
jgi:hypothetical protein